MLALIRYLIMFTLERKQAHGYGSQITMMGGVDSVK